MKLWMLNSMSRECRAQREFLSFLFCQFFNFKHDLITKMVITRTISQQYKQLQSGKEHLWYDWDAGEEKNHHKNMLQWKNSSVNKEVKDKIATCLLIIRFIWHGERVDNHRKEKIMIISPIGKIFTARSK